MSKAPKTCPFCRDYNIYSELLIFNYILTVDVDTDANDDKFKSIIDSKGQKHDHCPEPFGIANFLCSNRHRGQVFKYIRCQVRLCKENKGDHHEFYLFENNKPAFRKKLI